MNHISTEELLGRIIAWIQGIQAGDTKIEEDTQILALSLVDSMNLLMLVSHFEDELGVSLGEDAITPENFETPAKIAGLFAEIFGRQED